MKRHVDLSDEVKRPDYMQLPEPIRLAETVITHDTDPVTHQPESKFATPDIADLVRTNAIAG
jgi:hypothetical protein